jgi:AraC-like DNA-binding protein
LLERQPPPACGVQLLREAYGGPAVAGVLEIADIAWLQVVRMTGAGHRLVHRPTSGAGSAITIWLQVRGTSVMEQAGRTVHLVPGRWSLVTSQQPYTVLSAGPTQRIALLIPPERIHPQPDLDSLGSRSFSGTLGIARLAFDAARSVVDEPVTLSTMPAADLAESLCRLAGLALQEGAARPDPDHDRGTLVDRIHSYINEHLRDPDLSLDSIARNLSASKRSLHRAVREVNGSIHDLIWHTRLERCRSDLLDPVKDHLGIGDIAHSWGFKNLTHFSRAFRERFGISARDVRRLGQKAARKAD